MKKYLLIASTCFALNAMEQAPTNQSVGDRLLAIDAHSWKVRGTLYTLGKISENPGLSGKQIPQENIQTIKELHSLASRQLDTVKEITDAIRAKNITKNVTDEDNQRLQRAAFLVGTAEYHAKRAENIVNPMIAKL